MNDTLTNALQMHRAGQLDPAARLYEEVLAREPSHADVLHLLGVLNHQRGDHERAVALIGRALAIRPDVPAFYSNLAEAHRALGRWEQAAEACERALRLRPDYHEALSNLGLALQGQGRRYEAVDRLRRALRLRPDSAPAHNNLGLVLQELGRNGEASEHFRRAVAIDPGFAPARTNLGQWLLERGRADEALEHCREAARLRPDQAAMRHNLGNVLRALGRLTDAAAEYLEAARLDPDQAESHAQLGKTLRRDGRPVEALPWLRNAVRLRPEEASYWEALAGLHAELEQFAEAIPCWERVLELAPDGRAAPHLALGSALQQEGRLVEAGEHYRTALVLQPRSAAAHLDLGWLHEELGDLDEAEASYRDAIRMQPRMPLPHARLATLLRGKLPDHDLRALEDRLADPDLHDRPRARLLFALAHVLDARGDYERAADALRIANALTLGLNRERRGYDPADYARFIDGLIGAFTPDLFARLAGLGHDSRRPVFIVGLPRSGTTLVEQVLASHPRVHGAGELPLARKSFEAIPAALGRPGPPMQVVAHLDAGAIRTLAEAHLARLDEIDGGRAARVVDKMPDNYVYLGFLSLLFPNATFIHCRRDLRDVAVSCWMTDFAGVRWANDFDQIASRFRDHERLMAHWRATLPTALHEVDYEAIVNDLEGESRRLVAAIGLDWDPACLEFHRTRRPVRTASIIQVRQPVYTKSVARWRHYEPSLAGLFALLPRDESGPSRPQ